MLYGRSWYYLIPIMVITNVIFYSIAMFNHAFVTRVNIFNLEEDVESYTLLETSTETLYLAARAWEKADGHGKYMVGSIVIVSCFYMPILRMILQSVMWVGLYSRVVHSSLEGLHRLCNQCTLIDVSILATLVAYYKASGLSKHIVDCTDGTTNCFDIDVDTKIGYKYIILSVLVSYLSNAIINHMGVRAKQRVREDPLRQPLVTTSGSGRP